MRITIDSEHSDGKSESALREFIANPKEKYLVVLHLSTNCVSSDFMIGCKQSINIDFDASLDCVDVGAGDKVSQIISMFEKVSDARDLEFLKRYFTIKLK